MNDSILLTIKKLLGLTPDYTPFDMDLIININTFLGVLNQLGVGNSARLSDESTTWTDFLGDHTVLLDEVKTYVYLRVQMVFDPPASNLVAEAKKEVIKELEWRINVKVDPGEAKHEPDPTPSPDEDKDALEERLKAYIRKAITVVLNTIRGETNHFVDFIPAPDNDTLEERLRAYARNAITVVLNTLRGETNYDIVFIPASNNDSLEERVKAYARNTITETLITLRGD